MTAVEFNPNVHELHEFEFVRHMRREMNDKLIFGFRHRRTGNWVLAAWVSSPRGKLLELAILGPTPVGTQDIVESIRSMKRGSVEGEANKAHNRSVLSQMEKGWEEADNTLAAEMAEADVEINDWVTRKVYHNSPRRNRVRTVVSVPG